MRCIRISLRFILMSRCRAMRLSSYMCNCEQALMPMYEHRCAPLVETRKYPFVDGIDTIIIRGKEGDRDGYRSD